MVRVPKRGTPTDFGGVALIQNFVEGDREIGFEILYPLIVKGG